MAKKCRIALLTVLFAVSVWPQSLPHFQFEGNVLANNSYIDQGNIGEGNNDSLHCVTNNSNCCSNGKGNWYNNATGEVEQEPDRNNSLYVTRGDGVVYLNRRRGGSSGMWRCDIPDSNGVQQSIYIYLGTNITGVFGYVYGVPCLILLEMSIGNLSSAAIYFTLESEANEDPPEFTLTCQSRGGPATEVEWKRNRVRVVTT